VIRRGLASTLSILALAALCAATDLPHQWRAWHYSRTGRTFSAEQRSPFTLQLPFDLLARSDAHGSDIRVIDDQGQEVPYALTLAAQKIPRRGSYPRACWNGALSPANSRRL
jgi:hypothetical protein